MQKNGLNKYLFNYENSTVNKFQIIKNKQKKWHTILKKIAILTPLLTIFLKQINGCFSFKRSFNISDYKLRKNK